MKNFILQIVMLRLIANCGYDQYFPASRK
jgi:hypothetical protein